MTLGSARLRAAVLLTAASGLAFGLTSACRSRGSGIRNVLLITIDTLRADHLGSYGFPKPTTPALDSLAREGVLFRNALSPVPITLPAHSSIMTGTLPPSHGLHDNLGGRLPDSNRTLAKILKQRGLTTGAIVSSFVLDSRFNLSQGFDTYDDRLQGTQKANTLAERKGDETARLATAWLDGHRQGNFFLWVHLYDPHEDYTPPEPYASRFPDDPYSGEVAFADHAVGQILDKLKALGLFETTLVVATGDHGEMLGEHGELTHQFFVYQSALRVPLIFKVPGRKEAKQVDQLAGLVDIVPTICGLLGLPIPDTAQGEDLSPWLEEDNPRPRSRRLYAESFAPAQYYGASPLFALVTEGAKYIQTTRPELYDLEKDPGETVNLYETQTARAEAFRRALAKILETRAPQRESATLDEEARQRLQSLGYLGGRGSGELAFDFGTGKEDAKDLITFYRSDQKLAALMEAKKYEEARALSDQMLRERPGFVDGHLRRADIANAQSDFAAARIHYARVIELDPRNERAHFGLANLLLDRGDLAGAVAHYERALASKPDFAEARARLAAALNKQGRFEEAARQLQSRPPAEPQSPQMETQLGLALASQGKLDEAVEHYRRALAGDPGSAEAHAYLGSALASRGNLDEAIGHFETALRAQPNLAQVHERLGAALRDRGRVEEAAQHLREAVRLSPRRAEAHLQLGLALKQMGRANEAAEEYSRALALNPQLASAHNNLGSLRGAQGRMPEAVSHFRAALKAKPDYDEAHNNLGLALRMMGERDEALRHFEAALRLRPDWPGPMNEIAWILATHPDPRKRDPPRAVRLAERAATLTERRQPVMLDTLAAAYAAAGDFGRAASTAQEAAARAAAAHANALVGEIGKRLALYRESKPFREADRARP